MLLFFHSLVRLIKVRSRWQFVLRPAHNTAITCTMAAFGGLFELLSWFSYHLSLYLLPVAIFILCLLTIFLYIAMWAVMRSQPERPPGYKALHTTALATLVLLGTLWLPRCTLRLLNTPSPITPDLYGYIPDALHLVFCGVYFFLQRDFIKVNNSVSPADIEVLPESAPSPDRIASLPVIGSKFGGSAESVSAHIVAAVSIANIDQLSNSGRTSQTPLSLNNKHPGKWLSSLIIRPSQTSQSETEVDRSNLILDNLSVKWHCLQFICYWIYTHLSCEQLLRLLGNSHWVIMPVWLICPTVY